MCKEVVALFTLLALILSCSCRTASIYDLQLRFQNQSDLNFVTLEIVCALGIEATCLEPAWESREHLRLATYSKPEIGLLKTNPNDYLIAFCCRI